MHRLAALVVCLLLFPSCSDSPSGPTASFDVRLTIPLGQTAGIEGSRLGIRFDAVREDSRCPADAMCVWAGRAVVSVTLRGVAHDTTVELHSDSDVKRSATADGIRIELVQLDPYPFAAHPTQPGDYRVTVRVVR